ncbi:MAG: hypothetical protein F6K10_30410 [Moorea sp. SIO2B7]|nr:hypothetical protein [Moorena sp. SIO2B7]
MLLDVKEWTCTECGMNHDRDENAARKITAEGIRQLQALGTSVSVGVGDIRLVVDSVGKKQSPMNTEATIIQLCG